MRNCCYAQLESISFRKKCFLLPYLKEFMHKIWSQFDYFVSINLSSISYLHVLLPPCCTAWPYNKRGFVRGTYWKAKIIFASINSVDVTAFLVYPAPILGHNSQLLVYQLWIEHVCCVSLTCINQVIEISTGEMTI